MGSNKDHQAVQIAREDPREPQDWGARRIFATRVLAVSGWRSWVAAAGLSGLVSIPDSADALATFGMAIPDADRSVGAPRVMLPGWYSQVRGSRVSLSGWRF